MVKKNEEYDEEDDEEDDLIEHAPVAMDWVKDQHVERLHPKYWLGAARSLQYSADIIFEHERPFAEIMHAVAISELDKSHLTRWPNLAGAHLLYAFAFENLLKGIIIVKNAAVRDPTMWGTTEEEERPLKKTREERGLNEWMSHDVKKLLQLADISIPEPYLRLLWIFEGKPSGVAAIPPLCQRPGGFASTMKACLNILTQVIRAPRKIRPSHRRANQIQNS